MGLLEPSRIQRLLLRAGQDVQTGRQLRQYDRENSAHELDRVPA